MIKSKIVWALLDNRTGNRNQVMAILSALGLKYKIINIEYNLFSFFPNFFFQIFSNTIHVKSFWKNINETGPDVIISCGRRTATIAIELKKKFNFKPFCIHIM